MLIDLIVGARPNFIKIAPLIDAIKEAASQGNAIDFRLIHTGQHYDTNMSGSFFKQLDIPQPFKNLESGGGTQAEQTAAIMIGYETVLNESKPDITLVVGDVTSTMACAIVAKKAQVTVVHVEAGIRSGDLTMPEEINRIVTDSITDHFFTTTKQAGTNLEHYGIASENIFFVGNVMIDTLRKNEPNFTAPEFWKTLALKEKEYLVLTLHRPSNVDNEEHLKQLLQAIAEQTQGKKNVILPVHPRAAEKIRRITTGSALFDHLHLVDPMGYLQFNYLVKNSFAVITDSGGITEETTVLGIPCLTLRTSTERPETITIGTNELLGDQPEAIAPAMQQLFSGNWKKGDIPELWDGKAAERIIAILLKKFQDNSSANE